MSRPSAPTPARRAPTPGQVAQVQYLYLNTRYPAYVIAAMCELHVTSVNRIIKDDVKFLCKAFDREDAELKNSLLVRLEEDERRGVPNPPEPVSLEEMRAIVDESSYRASLKLKEGEDNKAAYSFDYLMDLVKGKKKLPEPG